MPIERRSSLKMDISGFHALLEAADAGTSLPEELNGQQSHSHVVISGEKKTNIATPKQKQGSRKPSPKSKFDTISEEKISPPEKPTPAIRSQAKRVFEDEASFPAPLAISPPSIVKDGHKLSSNSKPEASIANKRKKSAAKGNEESPRPSARPQESPSAGPASSSAASSAQPSPSAPSGSSPIPIPASNRSINPTQSSTYISPSASSPILSSMPSSIPPYLPIHSPSMLNPMFIPPSSQLNAFSAFSTFQQPLMRSQMPSSLPLPVPPLLNTLPTLSVPSSNQWNAFIPPQPQAPSQIMMQQPQQQQHLQSVVPFPVIIGPPRVGGEPLPLDMLQQYLRDFLQSQQMQSVSMPMNSAVPETYPTQSTVPSPSSGSDTEPKIELGAPFGNLKTE